MAEYQFVDTDTTTIMDSLIAAYETITKRTLLPADPDRLFLSWVASVIVQERVSQNYAGNQNIPSRAQGENLDALGEWIFNLKRKAAQPSFCYVQFNLSAAQSTAISVRAGTRVSDLSRNLVWETVSDALIPIGDTSIVLQVVCQTPGAEGNDYAIGQINTLIDVDNILFYTSCSNTTVSDGGTDEETDDEYLARLRASLDGYATAGSEGSYIYWAKSVSDDIADVRAIRPVATVEKTLGILEDGDGNKLAVSAGEHIDTYSLAVYPYEGETPADITDDYTVTYADGLLSIGIVSGGALDSETKIDVSYREEFGGRVNIYALMRDGTAASSTIKAAILQACNADTVRPLTDYVSVLDPESQSYNIEFTYYISSESEIPVSEIEANVAAAVEKYKAWQSARFDRDINPAQLIAYLMDTGIKRVVMTSPTYTHLPAGSSNTPYIAAVGTTTIVNGGYEDE